MHILINGGTTLITLGEITQARIKEKRISIYSFDQWWTIEFETEDVCNREWTQLLTSISQGAKLHTVTDEILKEC